MNRSVRRPDSGEPAAAGGRAGTVAGMGRQAASSVTATLESAEQFISIGTYDWYVSKSWNRLHAVTEFTDEHKADMEMEWAVLSPVRLACGRTAASLWIPGMFSRMGAERCKGCCRATGMPAGKGSPKNDDACRAILGLPANGDAAIVEKVTA